MDKLRVKDWETYQHYKKKNKNFNNEQPWFMFYGRRLLRDVEFMTLTIEQREFLIMAWAIGSQDNGFMPSLKQMAYILNRDESVILAHLDFLNREGWLEYYAHETYEAIQDEQETIIYENRIERTKELAS
ncbi:hypothetical protein N8804_01300 [Methylophilaceae bacterium]|nr:hypothetical protein [Methylophilaceae bacterium]